MASMRILCLVVAFCSLLAETARAQTASPFRPGRLADIVARHRADVLDGVPPDGLELVFAGNTEPTEVEARFAGQARPITASRREFITAWAQSQGQDPRWAEAFTEEWLFRADSGQYWLAVQAITAESMRPVVRAGTPMTLYTRWLGARVERGEPQWIFLLISATSDRDETSDSDPPDV